MVFWAVLPAHELKSLECHGPSREAVSGRKGLAVVASLNIVVRGQAWHRNIKTPQEAEGSKQWSILVGQTLPQHQLKRFVRSGWGLGVLEGDSTQRPGTSQG